MQISDSVAIVTGGASGLGEACARQLAAAGGKVALLDLNTEKGEAVAGDLGDSAIFIECDVADEKAVQHAIDEAKNLGTLRFAVSCAGVGWATRTVNRKGEPHSLDLFKKVIEINLVGTFNVLRLAAAAISQTEPIDGMRGAICNTASVAAFEGQIGQVAYAASKGGVAALTLPAARDLAKTGIRVMTIAPGIFDTPMLAALPEEARASLAAGVPNPSRLGKPSEYGALVRHIFENDYLNGEVIRCDAALRMAPK